MREGAVKMLGRGKDARTHVLQHAGALTGARFVTRWSAGDATQVGVARLVAAGFAERDARLPERLAELGSPWTARAVEIGDAKKSWRSGIIADLIEDTPLEIIPGFQRGIPPTLVVVAARELADGSTELVMYPHTSHKGDPGNYNGAAPRVREAVAGVATAATSAGVLVSEEKLRGIPNDGSPASQQQVRELLGWY